jgi:DNA-binding MarR family transcriptional regulator
MTSTQGRDVARQLPKAMARLRARLRAESTPAQMRWTWAQLAALARLSDDGPMTVTALAAAEHVRYQSMTETITALKRQGLLTSGPDPSDGRKTLISATARGRKLATSIPATREAWLGAAAEQHLSPAEQLTLIQAAQIMERLADS